MNEVIGKRKLSCRNAFDNLKSKDVNSFYLDAMAAFGITYRGNITRKIDGAYLSPIEVSAFEQIFEKYGITENIWTDVDEAGE